MARTIKLEANSRVFSGIRIEQRPGVYLARLTLTCRRLPRDVPRTVARRSQPIGGDARPHCFRVAIMSWEPGAYAGNVGEDSSTSSNADSESEKVVASQASNRVWHIHPDSAFSPLATSSDRGLRPPV
jgi:hypothetical protein